MRLMDTAQKLTFKTTTFSQLSFEFILVLVFLEITWETHLAEERKR